MFTDCVIDDPHAMVYIEEVEKCEGEARVNNRKQESLIIRVLTRSKMFI